MTTLKYRSLYFLAAAFSILSFFLHAASAGETPQALAVFYSANLMAELEPCG